MRGLPLIVVSALLSACSLADPDPNLTKFSSCQDLDVYMTEMALKEGRWGWSTNLSDISFGSVEYELSSERAATTFSETNLQEVGVDEADLVKTDGTFLYSVAGGHVLISQLWPVEEAREVSRLRVDGVIDGLYLIDDKLVVLSTTGFWEPEAPRSGQPHIRSEQSTLVTLIDVSDRSSPVVTRETYTSGALASSRRIGDRLFVVTYTDIRVEGRSARTWRDAKQSIEAADSIAWLPRRVDHQLRGTGEWETVDESSCGCTDVLASRAEGGTFITNVVSLDLSDPSAAFAGEAVVGRADTVYASPSSLYVAYTETAQGAFATFDGALDTVIHKFRIGEDEAKPRYDASAKIVGVLPDQFALSERDGVLRVATTDTQSWSSNVYTLEAVDGALRRLDVLRGLAPGEQLFSARFVGEIGYLVTYVVERNGVSIPSIPFGDPLFTIDLSDPTHIEAVGELQLNGWSDYIHPVDEDHLLTVGMDDGDGGWQVSVSLFDVSDLANPVLQSRVLPGSFSSESLQEHHAFNWYPTLNTLAIPGVDSGGKSGLDLIEWTADGELDTLGKLLQGPELGEASPWCQPVRRSVFLEDQVWAVSSAGLTAAVADAPGAQIAAVPFAALDEPCDRVFGGF